ncbi:MAG: SLBB domain-containing protein [Luteolibacter sp.]
MNLKKLFTTLLALMCLSAPVMAQIVAGKSLQIMAAGIPPEEKGRIDGIYPVSEAGTINMPFIGLVHAAGLRNEDLSVSLQNRYKSAGIYTNITIQVITNREGATVDEQVVYMGGQVRRPGPVPFVKGLTLYQAVQAGGGATEFGSLKRVKLFRGGSQKLYDLTQAQFMRIPLEPNDTIEVPQKNIIGQ